MLIDSDLTLSFSQFLFIGLLEIGFANVQDSIERDNQFLGPKIGRKPKIGRLQ
jgi:hypothetical protein